MASNRDKLLKQRGPLTLDQADPPALWRFAGAEFDEAERVLRMDERVVELEPRPLEILVCLLHHAGETLTKDELLLTVWGHVHLSENALSNAVGKLRKALGDEEQRLIVTVHRIGYRLEAEVTRVAVVEEQAMAAPFSTGQDVPQRAGWQFARALSTRPGREVWLAQGPDGEPPRVYKFSPDGRRLGSLKREAGLLRMLEAAFESPEAGAEAFTRVIGWNFDEKPYFLECAYGGEPLGRWLEAHGGVTALPLGQRLELLARIADAVAAAHSIGVLHKDLKPDNVLLSGPADAPHVRLTDFGSGRLFNTSSLSLDLNPASLTQTREAGGADGTTPLYLAPEVLLGHAPTVQSDLYALGVMLYQLVVGDLRRPVSSGWEQGVEDLLLRDDIAAAIHGEARQRLPSVQILAEHLRSLDARRTRRRARDAARTNALRTRRALQQARARRPWIATAGAALLLALGVSLWFMKRAADAHARERAEFAMRQAVDSFLNNDLLASANPVLGGSPDTTVRAAVQEVADRIDQRFADAPGIATALHQNIGEADRALGEYPAAEAQFQAARAISERAFGPASDEALISDLLLALVLAYENRYDDAASLLNHVDNLRQGRLDANPSIPMRYWDVRALLDAHRSNRKLAANDSRLALAALDTLAHEHPRTYEASLDDIRLIRLHAATQLQRAGDFAEAETLTRALIQDYTADHGPHSAITLRTRVLLVEDLAAAGRVDDAATELAGLQGLVDPATDQYNLLNLRLLHAEAVLALHQHNVPVARHLLGQVADGFARQFGSDNDETLAVRIELAQASAADHAPDEALGMLQAIYDAALKLQGGDSRLAQAAAYALVDIALNEHHQDLAAPYWPRLDAEALGDYDPSHNWSARLLFQHGRMAHLSGQGPDARTAYTEALRLADPARDAILINRLHEALGNLGNSA